jgi:phytoene dehydrogenase-like protein
MAIGSPFLTDLGLERYGLKWLLPEIDCVHPLDDGRAGVLHRSVDETAAGTMRPNEITAKVSISTAGQQFSIHHDGGNKQ